MARTIRRISKDNRVQQRPERSKAARLCGSGSTRRYERVKYPRDDHSTSVTLGGENIHGSPWLYLGSDLVKEIRLEGLGCLQLAVRTRAVSPQSSRGGTGWGHDNRAHGRVRARARAYHMGCIDVGGPSASKAMVEASCVSLTCYGARRFRSGNDVSM